MPQRVRTKLDNAGLWNYAARLLSGRALSIGELSKKLGLPTLEGELYRAVDAILNDGQDAINAYQKAIAAASDNAGFRLETLRHKNGDVDLTQLFVG